MTREEYFAAAIIPALIKKSGVMEYKDGADPKVTELLVKMTVEIASALDSAFKEKPLS